MNATWKLRVLTLMPTILSVAVAICFFSWGGARGDAQGRITLAREAEAEAWIRKNKRIIHNQLLIQLLNILAITLPIPIAALAFWVVFGLCSPLIIQGIAALWVTSSAIYVGSAVYARIRQRNL